jgi:hypothetical protein
VRVGIDRDEDGANDRDELDAGSDPSNAGSVPATASTTTLSTTTVTTSTSTSTTTLPPLTLIPARKLQLKDRTNPTDFRRRRIAFKSSTTGAPAANRVVPPAAGSAADPRIAGAALLVYNSSGLTDDAVIVPLPAAKWFARGTGYQYRDESTAAVTGVVLRADGLSIKGGRSQWTYTLNEPGQGRIALRLQMGGTVWCAEAPPKPGNPANDRVDRFVGRKDALPSSCPLSP